MAGYSAAYGAYAYYANQYGQTEALRYHMARQCNKNWKETKVTGMKLKNYIQKEIVTTTWREITPEEKKCAGNTSSFTARFFRGNRCY